MPSKQEGELKLWLYDNRFLPAPALLSLARALHTELQDIRGRLKALEQNNAPADMIEVDGKLYSVNHNSTATSKTVRLHTVRS